jgi:hypothetical protein
MELVLPDGLWRSVPMPEVFSWELDFLQPLAPDLGTAGVVLGAPFLDIGTSELRPRGEHPARSGPRCGVKTLLKNTVISPCSATRRDFR